MRAIIAILLLGSSLARADEEAWVIREKQGICEHIKFNAENALIEINHTEPSCHYKRDQKGRLDRMICFNEPELSTTFYVSQELCEKKLPKDEPQRTTASVPETQHTWRIEPLDNRCRENGVSLAQVLDAIKKDDPSCTLTTDEKTGISLIVCPKLDRKMSIYPSKDLCERNLPEIKAWTFNPKDFSCNIVPWGVTIEGVFEDAKRTHRGCALTTMKFNGKVIRCADEPDTSTYLFRDRSDCESLATVFKKAASGAYSK
jgi:hypothetical protein